MPLSLLSLSLSLHRNTMACTEWLTQVLKSYYTLSSVTKHTVTAKHTYTASGARQQQQQQHGALQTQDGVWVNRHDHDALCTLRGVGKK